MSGPAPRSAAASPGLRVGVILAAAGSGSRFAQGPGGGGRHGTKIEEPLHGRPVFAWSLARLRARPEVAAVVLAVDPGRREAFAQAWSALWAGEGAPVALVDGGPDRDATVRLALEALPPGLTHVAVHDAARPAVSDALLDRLFAAARRHPAVFPGVPVADTLRRVGPFDAGSAPAGETVPREGLVAVQTPQVFQADLLRRAHANPLPGLPTDDAGRVAALGVKVGAEVVCVPGDAENRKLTVREDLAVLAATLA